jgi:5-hydroxyisourate hydrolase
MAGLTAHVLDTSRGTPAAGMTIDLYRLQEGERIHITRTVTDSDGRSVQPLLSAEEIEIGVYELAFQAGEYFRALGIALPKPPFLDEIVIRFGVADAAVSYHVPLLLSPFGYSTYRGS